MDRTSPRDHADVIARFVDVCSADERIVAAFLSGSNARGEADAYSDLDLCLIATDAAYDDVVAERAAIIRRLGEPLFLERFGRDDIAFFILADGTEGELFFAREGGLDAIHTGPYRPLVDKTGILAGAEFPFTEPDPVEQVEELRRILHWFWHDLSHFIAALGRGQLWWAAGQLEALRALLREPRAHRAARRGPGRALREAGSRDVDDAAGRPAVDLLPDGTARDARCREDILDFYRERAPVVAEAYGADLPRRARAV